METKHLPGPWSAKQEYANRWRIEQCVDEGKVPFSIALVTTTVLEVGANDKHTAANAQLIAAGPELLEALEACYAALHPNSAEGQAARAAIAKATASVA